MPRNWEKCSKSQMFEITRIRNNGRLLVHFRAHRKSATSAQTDLRITMGRPLYTS